MISGPLRYYVPIQGHELVTRRDLIPYEPDHPRLAIGITRFNSAPWNTSCRPSSALAGGASHIIVTSGDRFMEALEINKLFEQESPVGQLYVRLKELGIQVEREWWIDEEGTAYVVDLALPIEDGWLPLIFGDRPVPQAALRGRG